MSEGRRRSFLRVPRIRRAAQSSSVPPAPEPDSPAGSRPAPQDLSAHSDERARIVIPRSDRAGPSRSDVDIELREIRYGLFSRGHYLRVVPRARRFVRLAPGHIQATELATRPPGRVDQVVASMKRLLLGNPLATWRLAHERLSKVRALGVFSSDALSSAAYGPEEIMRVLLLAGSGALYLSLPITGALLALLWIVRLSYIQTIKAYPSGGGAYIVAHENLGTIPGLVAAAALMVDYTLTVAVSVAAGVAAITSAAPSLLDMRVPLSLAAVAVITWGNLRGIRESGAMFGLPTYFFILSFGTMIAVGLTKVALGNTPGSPLHAGPPSENVAAVSGLSVFLVLRAFSSGAAALTGVEAISNGVPAFKPPESRNASITMQWEAAFLGLFLIGVAFLATRYGVVPSHEETVVSMLGRQVLGKNVLYYAYQVATAGILFLAANTAFADFPRLAALLAKDRFLPRQLAFRGDRLAFSNGIILLGGAASVLLVVFQATVTRLIPLYVLGVFISMTLSQSGMVRHWLRFREPGWRGSLALNTIGAAATAVVALVVAATKITHGAWISLLGMTVLAALFVLVRRHYEWFQSKVRVAERNAQRGIPIAVPVQPGGPREHVVVPVDEINKITLGAVSLAREISPLTTAVHVTDDREQAERFRAEWNRAVPDVPLIVVESPYRAFLAPMVAFLELMRARVPAGQRVTLILPRFAARHWWERLLHNRDALRLKHHLQDGPDFRIVDFVYDPNGRSQRHQSAQRH